jgi:DNA-directed RNA polymerase specialized sigma24 family protein
MMSDAQIRALAVFFYFAFQDERLSELATGKAIVALKSRQRANEAGDFFASLVSTTHKIWREYKKNIRSTQSAVSQTGGWLLPTGVDLGPWRQFRKESPDEEFLVIIWSQISKIPYESISKGLGITTGTVRHRVGRGLKRLGAASV